jgi:hypothetical protein
MKKNGETDKTAKKLKKKILSPVKRKKIEKKIFISDKTKKN